MILEGYCRYSRFYRWSGNHDFFLFICWNLNCTVWNVFTARKRSCGKVMFSQLSVILFERCALGHGYPPITRHGTFSHYWHLVVITGDMGPTPSLLLTSGGHHWRPVQTCSLEDLPRNRYLQQVVATETCTVSKRVVRILLECCLV